MNWNRTWVSEERWAERSFFLFKVHGQDLWGYGLSPEDTPQQPHPTRMDAVAAGRAHIDQLIEQENDHE